jgi:hypothetical protein
MTYHENNERQSHTTKLTEFPYVITRDPGTLAYGVPLHWADNEIIADSIVYSVFWDTGHYTFVAEARMPDGRRLFCFDATYFMRGGDGW